MNYPLILLLLSGFLANCQLKNNTHGNPVANGVSVTATLTRESFTINSNEVPRWKVTLIISNNSKVPVDPGESMLLVAPMAKKESYLAIGLIRNRKEASDYTRRIFERYGLLWGVNVPAGGRDIWNLAQFSNSELSTMNRFMLVMLSPGIEALPSSGYGLPIPAGGKDTIVESFPFPFNLEKQNELHQLILIPPSLQQISKPGNVFTHAALTFQVNGIIDTGTVLSPASVKLWEATSPDLPTIVADTIQPAWLRMAALNWIAESKAAPSGKLLLHYATNDSGSMLLRNSALINLGVWKAPGAINGLTAALQNPAAANETRVAGLQGLAELADPVAAPVIRQYLTHKDDWITKAAVEACGAVKDAEAVPILAPILTGKREVLFSAAANALQVIGTGEAHSVLISIAQTRKAEFTARRLAIHAVGQTKRDTMVPLLEAIAADKTEVDGMRMNAIDALSAIQSKEAVASLRKLVNSKPVIIQRSAISALARSQNDEAIAFLIEMARQEGPVQVESIEALGNANVTSAAQLMRDILHQQSLSRDVRLAAINAIHKMKNKEARPELVAAANDSDEKIYRQALDALADLFGAEAAPYALEALHSRYPDIRGKGAETLSALETTSATTLDSLWVAYHKEKDTRAGYKISSALIKLKWNDKNVIGWLVEGLDNKKNKLWFENVRLLQYITNQKFGPESEYSDKKQREAALEKWTKWWAGQQ